MGSKFTQWGVVNDEIVPFVEHEDYLRLQDKVARMKDALLWLRSEVIYYSPQDRQEAFDVIDQALGED